MSQQLLAESIRACKPLMTRHLAGFNSMNHTSQSNHLPNHVAWILGHCAMTMHRVAQHLDAQELPKADFTADQPHSATDDSVFCFYSETIAFGSKPRDDASIYPSYERCVQIYSDACDRLAGAVAAAKEEDLKREVTWGSASMPLQMLIVRIIFHNGMHTGQIADLRRALNMPSALT